MSLLDCINQISKNMMCTCCGKLAGLFSHMLFHIERELFILQKSGENSVLANLSRSPGYRQITEIPCLDFLKQAQVLQTCHVVLDRNEQTIYHLQAHFRQSGSKNDKPQSGRPRITTPLEVRVIVKSTWRNRFTAAWKLLKDLRHATGIRISVYTR